MIVAESFRFFWKIYFRKHTEVCSFNLTDMVLGHLNNLQLLLISLVIHHKSWDTEVCSCLVVIILLLLPSEVISEDMEYFANKLRAYSRNCTVSLKYVIVGKDIMGFRFH